MIAPDARIDDGLLDVTLIEHVRLGELAANVGLLYSGAIYTHPKVHHWRASRVHVETEPEGTPVDLDGEALGTAPLEAEVLPGAWRLCSEAEAEGAR